MLMKKESIVDVKWIHLVLTKQKGVKLKEKPHTHIHRDRQREREIENYLQNLDANAHILKIMSIT